MWLALGLVLLTVLLLWIRQKSSRFMRMLAKFPGPRAYPLVGNALQVGYTLVDVTQFTERTCKKYFGTSHVVWFGTTPYILITDAEDLEVILSSNTLLDKGANYDYTHPWIGHGLLTSTGSKWKKHRKILSPTFHFKMLEEFMDIFNANGKILVELLRKEANGPGFDIHNYMSLYSLDIISETAMGMKMNIQRESESDYVKAGRNMARIVVQRSIKPWLMIDFIFNYTSQGRIQKESLKILHGTTNSVLKTRKEEMAKERAARDVTKDVEDVSQSDGVKKRLAFLDMLIESTFNGSQLTDEDIREEVDTVMFGGHDTTASAISFTLWLLSQHQDVQNRVFQELEETFPDPNEPFTFRGLQDLKYMERVIKESLRLYPSVPMFVRNIKEDVKLKGNLVAPKGVNLAVITGSAHRNPDIFPDPDTFDPDRFLPENVLGRHPYAYIPFSAGPRNCIGQKFAMQELKSSIAHILRAFKLLPGTKKPNLVLSAELVLMSATGITVKIIPRN